MEQRINVITVFHDGTAQGNKTQCAFADIDDAMVFADEQRRAYPDAFISIVQQIILQERTAPVPTAQNPFSATIGQFHTAAFENGACAIVEQDFNITIDGVAHTCVAFARFADWDGGLCVLTDKGKQMQLYFDELRDGLSRAERS